MGAESIAGTIAAIVRRRPALASILAGLEPLLEARQEAAARLAPELTMANVCLPAFSPAKAAQGDFLLAGALSPALGAHLKKAGEKLLPLLCQFGETAKSRHILERFWLNIDDVTAMRLMRAIMEEPEELAVIALEFGLEPGVLQFTFSQIVSAVLRALVQNGGESERPWDEPGIWRQGYCPVCGSYPAIAWLDRARQDEKNAFLAGGGGKKHFYCDMCGASWTFRRGACPACGKEGKGAVEILHEARGRGERLDYCTSCRVYHPVIDLRELDSTPNLDAMSPGLLHLDMIAAERNLRPLKPSFWNNFRNPA